MAKATRTVDISNNGVTSQVPLIVDKNAQNEEAVARAIYCNDKIVSLEDPLPVHRTSRRLAIGNTNTSAANAAATVTFPAAAGLSNVISGIAFSYNGNPTGGRVTISDGANIVFDIDVTSSGAGFFPFAAPVKGSVNTALTVTLAAGGAGVIGKVSVFSRWTEAA